MKEVVISIGQEWYSLKESRTYMVIDVIHRKFVYPDGESYDNYAEVKFKSVDNRVKTVGADELVTDMWKMIKDGQTDIPVTIEMYPVPNRSRLERTDG